MGGTPRRHSLRQERLERQVAVPPPRHWRYRHRLPQGRRRLLARLAPRRVHRQRVRRLPLEREQKAHGDSGARVSDRLGTSSPSPPCSAPPPSCHSSSLSRRPSLEPSWSSSRANRRSGTISSPRGSTFISTMSSRRSRSRRPPPPRSRSPTRPSAPSSSSDPPSPLERASNPSS